MLTRRQFIGTASAISIAPLIAGGCAMEGESPYDAAVSRIWRHSKDSIGSRGLMHRELVRNATLAPSSHNTQCWTFRIEADAITIRPDFARRCPVVDPDDHHLFASLGCATENLVLAARANGLVGEPHFDPARSEAGIRISLSSATSVQSPLYEAITDRQCTRAAFDGRPLTTSELGQLERAGTGNGVRVMLLAAKPVIESVIEYVVAGNTAQMANPAFVSELRDWIRFDREEAVETGDGLFTGASGNPVVPRWLGSRLLGLLYRPKTENDKYALQLRSSSGVAVFVSAAKDAAHWIEAGRCYERFALQATALGIRNAMINQPVEVAALRPQFASFLGVDGRRPDLIARFGRGPTMPRSLRRPLPAVIA